MDINIPEDILRKRKYLRYIKLASVLIAMLAIMMILTGILKTKIDRNSLELYLVDKGTIEVSIGATGTVVPYYEEVITSPINSKIVNVYKKWGEYVEVGEAILELDLSSATVDYEADMVDLEIKRRKLNQYKLSSISQLEDLERQVQIDSIRFRRNAVSLTNEYYLDSIGASTTDMVRQVELEYEVSKLQFERQKIQLENMRQVIESDIRVYELEYNTAYNKLLIKQKTLGDARIISPRTGILSWVNDQIGTSVSIGTQLAKLADLSRFKVDAEISENYAGMLSVGNKAEIKIGSRFLNGNILNIIPSVNNGKINFTISLEDNSNEMLKTGLRVDVYLITTIKGDVLRIPNRSFYSGPGVYDIWVVDNNKAIRKRVDLGGSSSLYVEVKDGLAEGDNAIVSSMSEYKNRNEISIRNTSD